MPEQAASTREAARRIARSPLASSAEGTPFARLKVAQFALKGEAHRLALDEIKQRLVDVTEADAALDEIGGTAFMQTAHNLIKVRGNSTQSLSVRLDG